MSDVPEPEIPENEIPLRIPHSIEIERAVIGACLISIVFYRAVSEVGLKSDDFYILRLRDCWDAVKILCDQDIQPDTITLIDELQRVNKDEGIDYSFLKFCMDRADSVSWENMQEYARRMKDYKLRRDVITMSTQAVKDVYNSGITADEVVSLMAKNLQDISEGGYQKELPLAEVVDNYEKRVFESIAAKSPPGYLTGLQDFDKVLKGLKPGRSGLIAARPGQGKTSLLLTVVAFTQTRKVQPYIVFNSLEMTEEGILGRLAANIAEIDGEHIESPEEMTFEEQEAFKWANSQIKLWKLKIIHERNPVALYTRISRLVAMGKCDILINDYIGKFEAKAENRVRQVAIASSYMSKIAVDKNICVLTAAQVNRAIDSRGPDSELLMSDLKETGDLEQDADFILFINPDSANDNLKHCNLIKHRFGRVGRFELLFDKPHSKFKSCTARKIDMNREGINDD